jgi:hypothetical protein
LIVVHAVRQVWRRHSCPLAGSSSNAIGKSARSTLLIAWPIHPENEFHFQYAVIF